MEAEDLLDKIAQDEGFGNWDTVVLNCHHSVIRSVAIAAVKQALHQPTVSGSLPSEEDVFQWAVKKSESFEHNLLARQCFIEGAEYMRKWVDRGNGA